MTPVELLTVKSWLWQTTWQAALLAGVVGLITWMLGRRISAQARQVLWLLVFVRLAMPVLPGSPLSIFNLLPHHQPPLVIPAVVTFQPAAVWSPNDVLSAPATIAAPKFKLTIWDALLVGWIAGAILFLGRSIFATLRFSRRVNRMGRAPDDAIGAIIDAACREVGARPPTVLVTDLVSTPSLFGVIHPRLLLPAHALAKLDSGGLRSVILHELEHLGRRHLLADWILTIIRTVHWFNPATWWAHRQIRAARELICDQSVLKRLGEENSRDYGLAMLALAAGVGRLPRAVPLAAFAQEQKLLRQRIEAIASGKRKYIVGLGLIPVAIVVTVFMTRPPEVAQTPAPETSGSVTVTNSRLRYPDNWPATQPADAVAADRNVVDPASVFPADPKLLAQLDRVVPELKFDAIPFADALDFLKDVCGVNINVNWRVLEAAGIDRVAPVTARLRDIKFSKVLDTILRDAGGGKVELARTVEGNVITISTLDDLQRNVVTRVYDIRDLLMIAADSERQRLTDGTMKLIRETVGWNKYCTINEMNGQLIVTAQANVHMLIEGLVNQLRQTREVQVTIEAMVQDLTHESANAIWTALAADPEHPFMDDQTVSKLLTNRTKVDKTLTAPRLTLFNGQAAFFLLGGTDQEFNLKVQATVSSDRKYVTMTIKTPPDKELASIRKTIAAATKPTNSPLRFVRLTTKGETGMTISVPDGATLPVQMKRETFEIQPDGSEKTLEMPQENREVWMLIKPTIIIQREREQEQFPLLSSPPTTAGSGNR